MTTSVRVKRTGWEPASLTWAPFAFALATLSLLWPALFHGQPFLFPDSSAYVRVVDAAVYKAFGLSTDWTRSGEVERLARQSQEERVRPVAPRNEQEQLNQNRVPLLGRSAYYGVLAYISALTGSFWLLTILQAAIVGVTVLLLATDLGGDCKRTRFGWTAVILLLLTATTTAPFFTSFVMPDVFSGIAIISAAMLMFSPGPSRNHAIAWFMLCTAAALFHSSHVLILLGLGAVGAILTWMQNRPARRWRRIVLVACAAIIGLLGETIFVKGVDVALGSPPIRPSFLSARLIDDGPGLRLIREKCDTKNFYICEFRGRRLQGSDDILWSTDPFKGVFNTLDAAGKRRLANEQGRFVLEVAKSYPFEVLQSTASAVGRQLGLMQLSEFRDIDRDRARVATAPLSAQAQLYDAGSLAPIVDNYGKLSVLVAVIALLAMPLLIQFRLLKWQIAVTVVAGVLFNAIICGGLSTPHDRYGARVLWVIPLIAAVALGRLAPLLSGLPPRRTEPSNL